VKKKKECPRGEQCAFYHSVAERRDQKKIELPKKVLSLDLKPPMPVTNSHSFHVPSEFYETPYEDVRSSVKTTFSDRYDGFAKRSFGSFHPYNESSFITMEEKLKMDHPMHSTVEAKPTTTGINLIADPIWKYSKTEEEDLLKDPKIQYAMGSLD
jgi:hypothetical protein